MMYPRLKLARNLLTDDGVIFISIDDNEIENLKKICNEIFGEENFIANIIWERAYSPVNLKKHISESHDYALCFSKNINLCICNGLKRNNDANERYKNMDNDPRGPWKSSDLSVGPIIEEKVYEITTPSGRKVYPPQGYCWRLSKERFKEFVKDNRIWFGEDGNNVPSIKRFLSEVKDTITPMSIWKYEDVGHSQNAKQYLIKLFNGKSYFDYPKPVEYVKRMIELYSNSNSIILDFFSGSATTAEAVLKINSEDFGNRKFIMVQLPEYCDEKLDSYKDGFNTICDIGEKRIDLAGEKIINESENKKLDVGFKVFKLDSSNLTKWNPDVDNLEESLVSAADNIVEGRTSLDLVYEIMLKYGLELTLPVEEISKDIFSVAFGSLVVCLRDDVDEDVIHEIFELVNGSSVSRVVFKDNGFKSDSDKTNIKENLRVHGVDEFITI